MTRSPFPHVLDSTIMAAVRACMAKGMMMHVDHWKPRSPNVHLHAGAAYAKGLETARRAFYEEGIAEAEAVRRGREALTAAYGAFAAPEGSNKTSERMAGALEFYFERYPLSTDPATPCVLPGGGRDIECHLQAPLRIAHPETGKPLIYCARPDMRVDYAQAQYLFDDKTTSALGATWIYSWDLRSQFSGSAWLAQQAGTPVAGVIVRGVSILKTKYDTLQAITYRPQWMIDRWLAQTERDVQRMIEAWRSGVWDYNLDESCTSYGGCVFRQICMSEEPQPWLEMNFEQRQWLPLTREEKPWPRPAEGEPPF